MANRTQPSEQAATSCVLVESAHVLPELTRDSQRAAADLMRASSRAAGINRGNEVAARIQANRVLAIHLARRERAQEADQAAELAAHLARPRTRKEKRAERSRERARLHQASR